MSNNKENKDKAILWYKMSIGFVSFSLVGLLVSCILMAVYTNSKFLYGVIYFALLGIAAWRVLQKNLADISRFYTRTHNRRGLLWLTKVEYYLLEQDIKTAFDCFTHLNNITCNKAMKREALLTLKGYWIAKYPGDKENHTAWNLQVSGRKREYDHIVESGKALVLP